MDAPDSDDPAAWLVYADWLQGHAEERWRTLGEAIVLVHRAPDSAPAFIAAHRDSWVAELTATSGLSIVDWRGPFPRDLAISVEASATLHLEYLVYGVVVHPMAERVEALSVSLADFNGGASLEPAIDALVELKRPRALRSLTLDEPPNLGSPWETEPPHIGDVSRLWRLFSLERLTLDGHSMALGEVHAPRLVELTLRGVGAEALDQLARASLPELHSLRILVADAAAVPSLRPLLDGRLAALRDLTLGSRDSAAHTATLELLAELAALGRLESLDLAWMRIWDAHLEILARHRALLARIPRVRFNTRNLSNEGRARLASLGKNFELTQFRYV